MNKSHEINELATALAKAQGAMRFAIKDANNPFFKSKYADLSSVVEAIRDALATNGLSYMQHLHQSEKHEVVVETVILHASGQWISCGTVAIPCNKHDAQGYGSAMTYARRYSLSAAVGVVADDDDGNAAAAAAPRPPKPTPMPAKVKEAAAKLKQAPAKGTVSGDPAEGDLTGIGGVEKPSAEQIEKLKETFSKQLNMTPTMIEEECGFGPIGQWTMEQFNEAREVFKALKQERAAISEDGAV